jgi:hypothetical protein
VLSIFRVEVPNGPWFLIYTTSHGHGSFGDRKCKSERACRGDSAKPCSDEFSDSTLCTCVMVEIWHCRGVMEHRDYSRQGVGFLVLIRSEWYELFGDMNE